jgi:hypothetical protein
LRALVADLDHIGGVILKSAGFFASGIAIASSAAWAFRRTFLKH